MCTTSLVSLVVGGKSIITKSKHFALSLRHFLSYIFRLSRVKYTCFSGLLYLPCSISREIARMSTQRLKHVKLQTPCVLDHLSIVSWCLAWTSFYSYTSSMVFLFVYFALFAAGLEKTVSLEIFKTIVYLKQLNDRSVLCSCVCI